MKKTIEFFRYFDSFIQKHNYFNFEIDSEFKSCMADLAFWKRLNTFVLLQNFDASQLLISFDKEITNE